jgi:hypothetical protein
LTTWYATGISGSSTEDHSGADGPKIAADPSNEAVYVYWWNSYSSSSTRKNWIRKYTIDSQGQITAPGLPLDITAQLALAPEAIQHPSMAIKPAAAVGQDPTIYLSYASSDPQRTTSSCTSSDNWRSFEVTWYLSISTDGGANWDTPIVVDTDPACCLSATPVGFNHTIPSAAYDPVQDLCRVGRQSRRRHGSKASGASFDE